MKRKIHWIPPMGGLALMAIESAKRQVGFYGIRHPASREELANHPGDYLFSRTYYALIDRVTQECLSHSSSADSQIPSPR